LEHPEFSFPNGTYDERDFEKYGGYCFVEKPAFRLLLTGNENANNVRALE